MCNTHSTHLSKQLVVSVTINITVSVGGGEIGRKESREVPSMKGTPSTFGGYYFEGRDQELSKQNRKPAQAEVQLQKPRHRDLCATPTWDRLRLSNCTRVPVGPYQFFREGCILLT